MYASVRVAIEAADVASLRRLNRRDHGARERYLSMTRQRRCGSSGLGMRTANARVSSILLLDALSNVHYTKHLSWVALG